jgi:hypothetical protein
MALSAADLFVQDKQLKVLDLDIETRKIGFHDAGRFKPGGSEPVIIAMSLNGEGPVTFGLKPLWDEGDMQLMLGKFRKAWDAADVVTGHYIRKFDLPILQGSLFEFGFPLLDQKLVVDTKTDLVGIAGMSLSQENLSALKELEESKFHMNDNWWRKVARLQPEGLRLAHTRVTKDVIQHQKLRAALAEAGALNPPSLWTP